MLRAHQDADFEGRQKNYGEKKTSMSTTLTRVRVNKLQRQPPVQKSKKMVVNIKRKDDDGTGLRKRRVLDDIGNGKTAQAPTDAKRLKNAKMQPNEAKKVEQVERKQVKEKNTLDRKKVLLNIPIPVPLKKPKRQNKCESLNLHTLTDAISSVLVELPIGVVDIDKNNTDAFYSPQYAADVIAYAHMRENYYKISSDFLTQSGDVDTTMRAILVDWLIQVQNHLCMSEETLHLCVAMVDRFLSIERIALPRLQLLGITSLLVASKFEDRYPPTIDKLIHLTDNTYQYKDVIQMELLLLRVLEYQVNLPTPLVFLDRYLKALGPVPDEVSNLCYYLLDLTLPDVQLLKFMPSMRAAAVLYLTCKILLPAGGREWTPTLSHYSGYASDQLMPCMQRLARDLTKAEKSKFQGAFDKFASQSLYGGISRLPLLTSCEAVRTLSTKELAKTG